MLWSFALAGALAFVLACVILLVFNSWWRAAMMSLINLCMVFRRSLGLQTWPSSRSFPSTTVHSRVWECLPIECVLIPSGFWGFESFHLRKTFLWSTAHCRLCGFVFEFYLVMACLGPRSLHGFLLWVTSLCKKSRSVTDISLMKEWLGLKPLQCLWIWSLRGSLHPGTAYYRFCVNASNEGPFEDFALTLDWTLSLARKLPLEPSKSPHVRNCPWWTCAQAFGFRWKIIWIFVDRIICKNIPDEDMAQPCPLLGLRCCPRLWASYLCFVYYRI